VPGNFRDGSGSRAGREFIADSPPARSSGHPILATPSARLRGFLPSDRGRLVEVLAQSSCANATMDEPHDLDVNRAWYWINSRLAEEQAGYALNWAICPLSDDVLIGYVGLHDIDLERKQAELCFWLVPIPDADELLMEAAQTALAFAFETLHMNTMRAVSIPGKPQTSGILTSIGMRLLQPTCQGSSDWTRFNDVHIWTITRSGWEHRLLARDHS